jgi:hypothetical protein
MRMGQLKGRINRVKGIVNRLEEMIELSTTKRGSTPMILSVPRNRASVANGRNVAYIGHLMEDASMLILTGATIFYAKHSPTPSGRG